MKISYQIIGWVARLLCIGAILFFSFFALDAFSEGKSFLDQVKDFAIHLIPSFVIIVFLIISWKKPMLGGLLFLITGIVLSPWVYNNNININESFWMTIGMVSAITIPFVIVGVLFIWSSRLKRKYLRTSDLE